MTLRRAKTLGAKKDALTKPFKAKDLIEAVAELVRRINIWLLFLRD